MKILIGKKAKDKDPLAEVMAAVESMDKDAHINAVLTNKAPRHLMIGAYLAAAGKDDDKANHVFKGKAELSRWVNNVIQVATMSGYVAAIELEIISTDEKKPDEPKAAAPATNKPKSGA